MCFYEFIPQKYWLVLRGMFKEVPGALFIITKTQNPIQRSGEMICGSFIQMKNMKVLKKMEKLCITSEIFN